MDDYILAPYFSLKPNAITLYEQPEPARYFTGSSKGFENLKDNTNKYGEISRHSVKRLRKVIDYMLYLSKEHSIVGHKVLSKSNIETIETVTAEIYDKSINYKLTFITLTLPSTQIHTDNVIKKECLNHFLTVLRNKFSVDLYIWKAEKQENNNIHFHILANRFIDWKELRDAWNKIINKLGYVDRYRSNQKEFYKKGFRLSDNPKDKRTEEQQHKAYLNNLKQDFRNPNSTDIHALYKIRNISAYISKYLAKDVTKTERSIQIDSVKDLIQKAYLDYDQYNLEQSKYLTFQDEYIKYKELKHTVELEIENLKEKMKTLKMQGVEGRIWGCSSLLSKCNNLTELCPHDQVPDIDLIVKNSTGVYRNDIGKRIVTTYTFDMSKLENINLLLKNHLTKIIENNT